jgi:hypothetical protein
MARSTPAGAFGNMVSCGTGAAGGSPARDDAGCRDHPWVAIWSWGLVFAAEPAPQRTPTSPGPYHGTCEGGKRTFDPRGT